MHPQHLRVLEHEPLSGLDLEVALVEQWAVHENSVGAARRRPLGNTYAGGLGATIG
jgi:hypothetical protein